MLVSPKNAIVSLGVSCQTAYQIRNHERLISAALNDQDLAWHHSFFDNLMTPISAVISLFSSSDISKVTADEIEIISRRIRWRPHGLFFWHDKTDPGTISSKYTYLLNKTINILRSVDNIVFIISNTQSNLQELSNSTKNLTPHIHERDANEAIKIVSRFFGEKCRFIFIINPEIGDIPHTIGNSRSYIIEDNLDIWQGNVAAWQLIIRQFFGYYDGISDERTHDYLKNITDRYKNLVQQHAHLRERHNALRERLNAAVPTPRQGLSYLDGP